MSKHPRSSFSITKGCRSQVLNTIGLFAGRGDVILSMVIAFGGGIFLGFKLNDFVDYVKMKWNSKFNKGV